MIKLGGKGMAAAFAVVTVFAGLPATAARAGGEHGPYQVDQYAVPAVKSGVSTWVKTWWTSLSDICDVRVTISGPDVTVVYPESTRTYTTLRRTTDLAHDDTDYTAFNVTVTSSATRWIDLRTEVEYTKMPDDSLRPGGTRNVACAGKRSQRESITRLLVLE